MNRNAEPKHISQVLIVFENCSYEVTSAVCVLLTQLVLSVEVDCYWEFEAM